MLPLFSCADGSTYHTLIVFTSSDLGFCGQRCTTRSSSAILNMSRNSGTSWPAALSLFLNTELDCEWICCSGRCWRRLSGSVLAALRYTQGHIWACPPSEGDDYIFHCHPPDQKIPKPKRLQEWYRKMLDHAFAERILHDYKVSGEFFSCVTAIAK